MKKINYFVFFLLVIPAFTLHPQDLKTEDIDKYCSELNAKLPTEEGFYTDYFVHRINYHSNFRAIGLQNTEVSFYYAQPEDAVNEETGDPTFELIYSPPPKVTIDYNIAASQYVNIEYYYRDGKLVLYVCLSKGAYYCKEEKYYFNSTGLIKLSVTEPEDCRDIETLERPQVYERSGNFSSGEQKIAEDILKRSKEYNRAFDELIRIEGLEK